MLKAAEEMGRSPAEVALAWVMSRPAVTSILIGATRKDQLELNLKALDLTIPLEIQSRLDEASRLESNELDHFFEPAMQAMIHGNTQVRPGMP